MHSNFVYTAVAARFGIGKDFWINLFLTICGYIPGMSSPHLDYQLPLIPLFHQATATTSTSRSVSSSLIVILLGDPVHRTLEITKHIPALRNGSRSMALSTLPRSNGRKRNPNGQRDTTRGCLDQPWTDNHWKKARKVLLRASTFPSWTAKGLDKTVTSGDQRTNNTTTPTKPSQNLHQDDGITLQISRTSNPSNHPNE